MTDTPAIQTQGLVKRYGKRGATALKGLDLTVAPGEVFGFLGPNGAGKSTTIRILLDLIRPTSGQVRVLGADPRLNPGLRRDLGYLAGDFRADGRQTGRELLRYLGDLRGGVPDARIAELAERLGLDLSTRLSGLSKGNRQKVGLIQAFMHRPKLLILDEPSSGLDPLLQHRFVELVREARAQGQTVFMSSHVMSEVQQTCDRVAIIRAGELAEVADVEQLRRRALRRVEVRFAAPVQRSDFQDLPGVSALEVDGTVMRCRWAGEPDALVKALARYHVVDLISEEPELEELFIAYYQGVA